MIHFNKLRTTSTVKMFMLKMFKNGYRIAQNITLKIFDGKYFDGWSLSFTMHYKCCIVKQFDGLNFDGPAVKHQKYQNSPLSKFCAIW